MKTLNLVLAAAVTGSLFALAPVNVQKAEAACVKSHWQLTSGNALANTIKGRNCGPNGAVRLIGIVDTGWIKMSHIGGGILDATFVDNDVTTEIKMKPVGTNMNVTFTHIANDGSVSYTTGNYNLVSMQ